MSTASKDRVAEQYLPVRDDGEPGGPEAPEHEYLQIGDVAELTGLTQRALRYYEELQLLEPPTRMASNFRLYSPRDVARIRHILRLKQLLGFSLAEIKLIVRAEEALDRWESGDATAGTRHRLEQIDTLVAGTAGQLDLLGRKIAEMTLLRDDLAARLHRLEARRAALVAEHEGAQLHAASEYS